MEHELIQANTPEQFAQARALLVQYAAEIQVDLCFQGFQRELDELPGEYGPPSGRLLLASDGGEMVGCVALRPVDQRVCELKRLYVQPAFRGRGLGRRLATAVVDAARTIGYERMRLDTLGTMVTAIALYRSLGFVDVAPYRFNPLPGATFMEADLKAGRE
jgi:putative acetyltransferase